MKTLSREQAFRKMKKWQQQDPPCLLLWLEVRTVEVEGKAVSMVSGPSVVIRDVSQERARVWLDNSKTEITIDLRDARFRADPETGELEIGSPGGSLHLLSEFDTSHCLALTPVP